MVYGGEENERTAMVGDLKLNSGMRINGDFACLVMWDDAPNPLVLDCVRTYDFKLSSVLMSNQV